MSDLHCPYCEAPQEVCHDDGFGYDEDVRHEMECSECGKSFVFTTGILYHYEAFPADCLNGEPHDLYPPPTYPIEYSKMQCRNCDYARKPTDDEMRQIRKERGDE